MGNWAPESYEILQPGIIGASAAPKRRRRVTGNGRASEPQKPQREEPENRHTQTPEGFTGRVKAKQYHPEVCVRIPKKHTCIDDERRRRDPNKKKVNSDTYQANMLKVNDFATGRRGRAHACDHWKIKSPMDLK